jgi:hypothetical protein
MVESGFNLRPRGQRTNQEDQTEQDPKESIATITVDEYNIVMLMKGTTMLEYYEKYIEPENDKLKDMLDKTPDLEDECEHEWITEDQGVGPTEFWGAVSNNVNIVTYCELCNEVQDDTADFDL